MILEKGNTVKSMEDERDDGYLLDNYYDVDIFLWILSKITNLFLTIYLSFPFYPMNKLFT